MLFFVILIMSFLRRYITNIRDFITKLLGNFVIDSKYVKNRIQLELELKDLTEELDLINMMDEFAKYARTQRKQEQIKENISKRTNEISTKLNGVKNIVNWTLQILITVFYGIIMLYYRYEPVIELPLDYVTPHLVGKVMAFPNGIIGNVGVIFWAVVCNTTINSLLSKK